MSAISDSPLPFIPSRMDDAGLTPPQFRVACRVARRGDCYESIQNIATGCRLSMGTVKKVLRLLAVWNVVAKEKRTGKTSIYKLNPPGEWRIEPRPNGYLGQTDTQPLKRPKTQVNPLPTHLGQSATHKGNPIKVIPVKGEAPPISKNLYPKEYKQLIADAEAEIKRLSGQPDGSQAIEALRQKIGQWKSAMLGVDLPAVAPKVKPAKPAPAVTAAKPVDYGPELAARFKEGCKQAIKATAP